MYPSYQNLHLRPLCIELCQALLKIGCKSVYPPAAWSVSRTFLSIRHLLLCRGSEVLCLGTLHVRCRSVDSNVESLVFQSPWLSPRHGPIPYKRSGRVDPHPFSKPSSHLTSHLTVRTWSRARLRTEISRYTLRQNKRFQLHQHSPPRPLRVSMYPPVTFRTGSVAKQGLLLCSLHATSNLPVEGQGKESSS